jgi:hypothetical protein
LAHILKDFFTGSLVIAAGLIISFLALLVLILLWIFFHILGALVWIFLLLFLFFGVVWFIGLMYRKIRETR